MQREEERKRLLREKLDAMAARRHGVKFVERRELTRAHMSVAVAEACRALSGSHDRTWKLFCVDDGVILRSVSALDAGGMPCIVGSMALLPDGRRFAAAFHGRDDTGQIHSFVQIIEHGLEP